MVKLSKLPLQALIYSVILFSGFLTLSNSGGRAAATGLGNTGAPGDQYMGQNPIYCNNCHGGNAYIPQANIAVLDSATNLPVSSYIPNTTYKIVTTVSSTLGTPNRYGFQLCATKGTTTSGINTWHNPSANARITTTNGKTYVEHNLNSTSGVFNVYWKSPVSGTGKVNFYSCGVASNGNGNDNGDGAKNTSLSLAESTTGASEELKSFDKIIIKNTIVKDGINIDIKDLDVEHYNIYFVSIDGRSIFKSPIKNFISLNQLSEGVVFYYILDNTNKIVDKGKLLKLE